MKPAHEIHIATRLLQDNSEEFKFKLPENATLLEVLQQGSEHASVVLLPDSEKPFDLLHNIIKHDEIGPVITELDQSLDDFLKEKGTTHEFGIELVLAIRVNTRWAVATKISMTPREILALPGMELDFQSYTLYLPSSADVLPLDTPITLERGKAFEAQRDGRYGRNP